MVEKLEKLGFTYCNGEIMVVEITLPDDPETDIREIRELLDD